MKFVCDRCQTKYSIADEKVRGKILKVRCKACTNIITVREEGTGAGAAPIRRPSAPASPVGTSGAFPGSSSGTRPPTPAVPRTPLGPPATAPIERRAAPRPEPPADDGVAWYMALDGNRTGPFSRKQLIDRVAPLPKDADLHVWNEKLGSWKPPTEVPALAHDLAARRRPPTAAPMPPPPPPFPGAPRRPTGPVVPLAAGAAPASARQTGAHPVVGSAIGPGVGLKLPPPVAPPGGRRQTGPIARPISLADLAPAVSSGSSDGGLDIDPSSMLETPAPQLHMLHGLGSNGVAHADQSASNGTSSGADKSDVLNTLNLASASGAEAAPRLLSSEAVVGWQPSAGEAPAARQRTTYIILAFLGVIAAVCVVLFLNVAKKPKPVASLPSKTVTDPLAGVVDNPQPPSPSAAAEPPPAVASTPEGAPEGASSHGHGKGHPAARGRGAAPTTPTAPPPVGATTAPPAPAAVADNSANARYRDGHTLNISGGSGISRPAPSQSDISRVINNNRGGIKNCYQRALLRDNSLTHGKISVKVTIGISGRVKHTAIDGPPQFRALDPCIKEVVGRWAFPQAGDEYGTEFVYVFQGNE
jgi:predicted Zn finger-like uncharacterized protein